MSDFDLSQALTGSPTSDEVGCETTCSNVLPTQNEHFILKEGLDLVSTHNSATFKRVAKLVLVLKKFSKKSDHQPSNDELYCVNMDNLVDETVVRATENSCTGMSRDRFQRVNAVSQFTLCDISQKDVVHGLGDKMQAITLKGGHSERKVKFEQSRYIHNFASADDVQSVVLTIINSNLHISCSMEDGKPVLNLEECRKEHLKTISTDGHLERFLFYKRTIGISMTTFESVKFRGWFISTSCECENEPLEMCEADAARRVTCFKLNEKHC